MCRRRCGRCCSRKKGRNAGPWRAAAVCRTPSLDAGDVKATHTHAHARTHPRHDARTKQTTQPIDAGRCCTESRAGGDSSTSWTSPRRRRWQPTHHWWPAANAAMTHTHRHTRTVDAAAAAGWTPAPGAPKSAVCYTLKCARHTTDKICFERRGKSSAAAAAAAAAAAEAAAAAVASSSSSS